MSKALVVFSGGQDSSTCLYYALKSMTRLQPLVLTMVNVMMLR